METNTQELPKPTTTAEATPPDASTADASPPDASTKDAPTEYTKVDKNKIDTIENLKAFLNEKKISIENWGKDGAKSVDNLLKEIEDDETILLEKGDKLVRVISAVWVKMLYKVKKDILPEKSPGLGSRQIILRLRLLTFFSSGSGSGSFNHKTLYFT